MSEHTGTSTAPSAEAPHADRGGTSEADFLQKQADDAKAAIGAALADAKAALADGVDPATWARRYPVIAIGSALVAGFATAVLTIPSREQQELRRIEKIAKALHPEPPKVSKPQKDGEKQETPVGPGSFWAMVMKEALAFVRPLLATLISTHFSGQNAEGKDGQPDGAAAPPPGTPPRY